MGDIWQLPVVRLCEQAQGWVKSRYFGAVRSAGAACIELYVPAPVVVRRALGGLGPIKAAWLW